MKIRNMRKQILLFVAVAFTLSSCGIYSKYKPVSEVPDGLYGSTDESAAQTADTANFGNLAWREVFSDPFLQTLIDSALVRNTDLQTAQLRVKEAEAALMTSKLSYLPSLFLAPEGSISSFDGAKATKTYSLPATASWEIDLFGRLTNAKRGAKAALLQSREYEQAVQTQLVASVANAYYTLLMLDAQYEIATATEKAWKESVAATRAMKAAGMVTEAGLAQTEATYYNICTTVLDLKEQINQTQNSLSLILAEVPHDIQRGKLAGQQLPETFATGIPLQMLSNRPDVRSAELSLAQAFFSTNAARSAFYPSITLGGSAGWTNSAGSMIVNPGKLLAYNCSPSFNWQKNLDDKTIASFQQQLSDMGYKFQFITLAGIHSMWFNMFDLANAYAQGEGMKHYVEKVQQPEFAAAKDGYTFVSHQQEVGTGYFDKVTTIIQGGTSSVTALTGSTEESQF